LRDLATVAGWPVWYAWLLPVCVDAYAVTATRVWLVGSTRSRRARRFARTNAGAAIFLSLAGNACWHLVAAHLLAVSWPVVLAVGAVPPLILGAVSHLAVLRSQVDLPVPEAVLSPAVRTEDRAGTAIRIADGPRTAVSTEAGPADGPGSAVGTAAGPGRSGLPRRATESGPQYETAAELLAAARAADAAHRAAHGRAITRDALRQTLRIGSGRATEVLRQLKTEPTAV
jgi:hypothetical protein